MNVQELFSLNGKRGFITGGARGIGRCLAEGFAEMGADIALVDINIDLAKQTAEELGAKTGRKILAYQCDVTDPASVEQMMEQYVKDYGQINFAINNAGICINEKAEQANPDSFRKVMDINTNGVFFTAQAAGKAMIGQKTGGTIVNTASMSGHIVNIPQPQAAYNASKAAVRLLTQSLAVEWAQHGIRVNSVSPGYIMTEMTAQSTTMHPIWISHIPVGRIGLPEELIGAYLYLASEASTYTTGTDIIVDGGYISQ